MLLSRLGGVETLGLGERNSGIPMDEATYDFYGVTVRIRSDSSQVVSSLDSVYHFFRTSGIGRPHLQMTLLVKGERPLGTEQRLVFACVPASFDGWKSALLNRAGASSFTKNIVGHIQEVDGVPSQPEPDRRFYRISQIESWYADWTAGVEFLIFHFVMHHLAHLCVVHAGVVARGDRGLLLCGPPDSGKSVLSYALVRQGFRYLSDEFGLFAPGSLKVFPFPRGISFKPEAAGLFPELGSVLAGDDVVWRQEKRHLIALENLGFEVTREAARASYLFFVSHEASSPPQAAELPATDAAERLLRAKNLWVISPQESRSFSRNEAAARLCDNARCYELLSGDLDRTVELIETIIEKT